STAINFFTNNLQRMSIGSGGAVQINSLVGPGLVQADASGILSISTAALSGSGTVGAVSFWTGQYTLTGDGANFYWNNTNKRLGIGNTNPQVKLHLSSDNAGNNVNLILEASEAGAVQGPGISLLRSKGTLAAPTAVVLDDYLGGLAANGRTASQYNMSSNINFEVDAAVAGNSVPGRIVFSTTSSTGTLPSERMRINSLGNIGIGITTPLARMHLKSSGTTTATSSFTIQNSVNTLLFDVKDNGMVGIATGSPVARLHVRGLGTTTATDAIIVENTAGTVVFDIQDDGSVGIGTGAPVAPLQVMGDARFFGSKATPQFSVNLFSNTGSGPRIGFSDITSSLNTYMEIGSYGSVNNIDNKTRDFRIFSNATSTAGLSMLAANGYVGIGTTTPSTTLQVNGSLSLKTVAISAAYTVAADDFIILLNTGGAGNYTVTLPSAALFPGRVLVIKRFANAVVQSIAPIAGQTLYSMTNLYSNASPYPMNATGNVYSSITIVAVNGNWWMINQD
ncbi:MAG: hypothetical protein K2Q22_00190, partial [Cytophagales bacterium]|nr:hypothetical protein [Cytophagales bacterium]